MQTLNMWTWGLCSAGTSGVHLRTKDGNEVAVSRHLYIIPDCFADLNDGHTEMVSDSTTRTPRFHHTCSLFLPVSRWMCLIQKDFCFLQISFPNPASVLGQTQWLQRTATWHCGVWVPRRAHNLFSERHTTCSQKAYWIPGFHIIWQRGQLSSTWLTFSRGMLDITPVNTTERSLPIKVHLPVMCSYYWSQVSRACHQGNIGRDKRGTIGAGEIPQLVETSALMSANPSLFPETHMVEGETSTSCA